MKDNKSISWRQVWSEFFPLLGNWWRSLSASYLLGLCAVAAAVLAPWPLKYIIDNVLANEALPAPLQPFQQHFDAGQLILLLAGLAALIAILGALCTAAEKNINARVREKMALEIRASTLDHITRLSLSSNTAHRSGELVMRLVTDVHHVVRLFTKTLPLVIRYLLTTLIVLGAMFWVAPQMGALGLGILLFMVLLVRVYAGALQRASRNKRRNEGKVAALSQEIISGLPGIQATGAEARVRTRFIDTNKISLHAGVRETRVAVNMERTMKIANGAATALIIGAGGLLVMAGKLSLGELTICISYIHQLLKPVEKINELASAVARGTIRGEQLIQLLQQQPEIIEASHPLPLVKQPASGDIELKNLTFAYPATQSGQAAAAVFENINLHLKPGSFTVLEGASGSGKSTLLNLLLRLYDPQRGEILIDGRPSTQLKIKDLRSQFAVMLQTIHIFAGSLREALQPPHRLLPDRHLWRVLKDVALDDFVSSLPQGLDTPLGECASNISGGQRARLALCRALLSARPILLLDEPLANVDKHSQQVIINALKKIKGQCTCLAVSHQAALRQCADRVIHLKNGHFIEVAPTDHSDNEVI